MRCEQLFLIPLICFFCIGDLRWWIQLIFGYTLFLIFKLFYEATKRNAKVCTNSGNVILLKFPPAWHNNGMESNKIGPISMFALMWLVKLGERAICWYREYILFVGLTGWYEEQFVLSTQTLGLQECKQLYVCEHSMSTCMCGTTDFVGWTKRAGYRSIGGGNSFQVTCLLCKGPHHHDNNGWRETVDS